MTSHDITCAAGGSLPAAATGLAVVEHPADQRTAAAPASPAWQVETAAPGSFAFRCQPSGQVLTVSGRDETLVILAAAARGTRHHWRIIHYPERRNLVIISRDTSLALTAGPTDATRPAPVRLTAYNGASAQHWSFTDPRGGADAIQHQW